MIYTRQNKHRFKWLLGFVIFVLVLSVTFDEVFGLGVPPPGANGNGSLGGDLPDWYAYRLDTYEYADNAGPGCPETSTPPEVPEPATLILLASGLGVLHLMRRKNA